MNRDEDATRSSDEYLRAPQALRDFARRVPPREPLLVAIGNMVCPGSRSAIGIVEIGNVQGAASAISTPSPGRIGAGAPVG